MFTEDGYEVMRGLLGDYATTTLYQYTLKNKINGDLNDDQIIGTPSFYNDQIMVALHKELTAKIEKVSNLELFRTYCYYRTYKIGDVLRAHTDRPACEISVTLNLGGNDWAISIMNHDENPQQVYLKAGDGLLYRGCECSHWRGKNINSDNYSQVFLHYVDQNGPNSWAKDDKKL